MIQYEKDNVSFGSQYSSLNYIGSYYKGDNLRKIAVVPFDDVKDITEIEELSKSSATAILFIIPTKVTKKLNALVNSVQIYLRNNYLLKIDEQTLYLPVYFVHETEELNQIVKQLKDEFNQSSKDDVFIIL